MFRIQLQVFFLLVFYVLYVPVSADVSSNSYTLVQSNLAKLILTKRCVDCVLIGADLEGVDLNGVNMAGSTLNSANLSNTNFRGAKLQGVSMLGVTLDGTMFAGADLRDADFSDLDIDEVFESIEIIGTLFEGAKFMYGVVCGPPPSKGGWGCQHL